jgi:hypothetical protein
MLLNAGFRKGFQLRGLKLLFQAIEGEAALVQLVLQILGDRRLNVLSCRDIEGLNDDESGLLQVELGFEGTPELSILRIGQQV